MIASDSAVAIRETIKKNIDLFYERLEKACARAGRSTKDIKVVAVSKTFSSEYIRAAYEFGIRDFGENYVQEAIVKMNELKDLDISWHFIGRIQTNKIKHIVGKFEWVHSLSSEEHILEFEKRAKDRTNKINVLLQLNIGKESTKSGIHEEFTLEFVRRLYEINPKSIKLVGLMIIPPPPQNPEDSRKFFTRVRKIRDELLKEGYDIRELSMGMSDDFEVAVEEGATILRIGRLIFGERKR